MRKPKIRKWENKAIRNEKPEIWTWKIQRVNQEIWIWKWKNQEIMIFSIIGALILSCLCFISFISRFLDFLSFIISRFPYLREFFAKHEFCLFRFVFNVAIHGRLLQGEVVFLRRTFVPLSGRFPIKQTSLCTWISSGMMYCKSCSQVILIKLNTCQCKKESSFLYWT